MCEQPHLPKLCFSNSLIYHNMIFWLYYTTTYIEKKPQNPSVVARRGVYFAEKGDTSERPPHPFYSQVSSFANFGSAWLLQGDFPDLGFLVWSTTIQTWQNSQPTEPNHRFSPAGCSPTLRPISSIKTGKAIMGPRGEQNGSPKLT